MLRRRKSPHGRQVPSLFITIWRRLAQSLSDLRTIPSSSRRWNSSLAAVSLALSSRLNLAVTGRPEVMMWCSTPWVAGGRRPSSFRTDENSARSDVSPLDSLAVPLAATAAVVAGEGEEDEGGEHEGEEDEGGEEQRRWAAESTSSWNFWRKSTPSMRKFTAAKRKHQVYRRPPKLMVSRRRPQQGIFWPPADLRRGPVGGRGDEKGRML